MADFDEETNKIQSDESNGNENLDSLPVHDNMDSNESLYADDNDSDEDDSEFDESVENEGNIQKEYREMLTSYGMGALNFGGFIIVGFLIGRWLDSKFGIEPILTMTWTILGFIGGVMEFVKIIRKAKNLK